MLSDDVSRYVELRRSLGFKVRATACLLRRYAEFAEARGDSFVQTRTVMDWAVKGPSAPQRRERLNVARRFARHVHAEDQRHEVPPARAFGTAPRPRRMPHIYAPEEIQRLLRAAAQLRPAGSIRAITYVTLLSLLFSTGLRISEALALQMEDITPDGLVVRHAKFRKSRLVPLHPTARDGIERYLVVRRRVRTKDRAVFVSRRGHGLAYSTAYATFLKTARSAGLRQGPGTRRGPGTSGCRLHDARHTFAVRSLESCRGADAHGVARHALALSTYLGHAHPSSTFWYLHATPALMRGIAVAGESFFGGRP